MLLPIRAKVFFEDTNAPAQGGLGYAKDFTGRRCPVIGCLVVVALVVRALLSDGVVVGDLRAP